MTTPVIPAARTAWITKGRYAAEVIGGAHSLLAVAQRDKPFVLTPDSVHIDHLGVLDER